MDLMHPQYTICLGIIKTGDKINSNQFVQDHRNEFTQRKNAVEAKSRSNLQDNIHWQKIGMIKEISLDDSTYKKEKNN